MSIGRIEKGNTTDLLPVKVQATQKDQGASPEENDFEAFVAENSSDLKPTSIESSGRKDSEEGTVPLESKTVSPQEPAPEAEDAQKATTEMMSFLLLQSLQWNAEMQKQEETKEALSDIEGDVVADTPQAQASLQVASVVDATDTKAAEVKEVASSPDVAEVEEVKAPSEILADQDPANVSDVKNDSVFQKTPVVRNAKTETKKQEDKRAVQDDVQRVSDLIQHRNVQPNLKEEDLSTTKKFAQSLSLSAEKMPESHKAEKSSSFSFEVRSEVITAHAPVPVKTDDLSNTKDVISTKPVASKEEQAAVRSVQLQIRNALNAVVKEDDRQVMIKLDPPDWGRVHVQIRMEKAEVRLEFMVEHSFVKDALDKGVGDLRMDFNSQGLNLGDVHVGMGGGESRPEERNQDLSSDREFNESLFVQKATGPKRAATMQRANALVDTVV